jgi:DNA-binding GntR family transcriptional regulator
MSAGTESKSAPDSIADALRDDLLNGILGPGARLTEESLSERFGAGRHSVRSALQILASEGLLEHRRNRGIVVPEVTAGRIDEMCSYRSTLEMGALTLALAHRADFGRVSAAVDQLAALDESVPWRRVIEAHSAIHRRIVEASGNGRLVLAHASCENELNCMLAIIRTDFTIDRLAEMHHELVEKLTVGGDSALHALDQDLELGGRAAMHSALERQRSVTE